MSKQLLTITEVSEQISLSRWTVTQMLESGALPGLIVKSGRRKRVWRVREDALAKWIDSKEQETKKLIGDDRKLKAV